MPSKTAESSCTDDHPPCVLCPEQVTLNELRKAQLEYSKSGRLVSLINQVDRGPMLAWLMVAPHHNVAILKNLLEELLEADGSDEEDEEDDVLAETEPGPHLGFFGKAIKNIAPPPQR